MAGSFKAIVYAGRELSGLYPSTTAVPKALLPVYDKPLVYYGLSVVLLAGIRDVALVLAPGDRPAFERALGDGSKLGLRLVYREEEATDGPARPLAAAGDFLAGQGAMFVLGDALIYGDGLQNVLADAKQHGDGATIFAHPVKHSERHAIVELADDGTPRAITDRPVAGSSNLAVMGISFFDERIVEVAGDLQSTRSESPALVEVCRTYLAAGQLRVTPFGRGFAWLDTSTHAALAAAANFIETIESTHGLKIGCLEEIAYRKGFITAGELGTAADEMPNAYGEYLRRLLPRQSVPPA